MLAALIISILNHMVVILFGSYYYNIGQKRVSNNSFKVNQRVGMSTIFGEQKNHNHSLKTQNQLIIFI